MNQLQPVITDYDSTLEAMGDEPMTTRQVAKAVGLGMETTRTKLHAAQADGFVELTIGKDYRWRRI